ncbi:diguanylate cyclase [Anopheles sinensis]|uniref:Diguanylate cyclase n=1 Tax=Anopheles sinensis TaxID=74873 RepID=A0A084VTE4_ANOSI|nr:diguanylate cyclase [Anopheles sinensis]
MHPKGLRCSSNEKLALEATTSAASAYRKVQLDRGRDGRVEAGGRGWQEATTWCGKRENTSLEVHPKTERMDAPDVRLLFAPETPRTARDCVDGTDGRMDGKAGSKAHCITSMVIQHANTHTHTLSHALIDQVIAVQVQRRQSLSS